VGGQWKKGVNCGGGGKSLKEVRRKGAKRTKERRRKRGLGVQRREGGKERKREIAKKTKS
jgi:hypothetical protein